MSLDIGMGGAHFKRFCRVFDAKFNEPLAQPVLGHVPNRFAGFEICFTLRHPDVL